MALKVGQKAPDFVVNDQDGKKVSLAEYKGKKVVLYFYPKDQTPGCTAESCNLRDNYRLLQKKGYEVIGVSTDSEKSHQKFIEKQKLPFRLLADVEKVVHSKYGTWIEKSLYGRKYMGTARITYIIDARGIIKDIISKVDTKDHTSQILNPGENTNQKLGKVIAKKSPKKKITTKKVQAKKEAPKKLGRSRK